MPINKPYYRTSRQLVDGSYADSGNGQYVSHPEYAKSPEQFVRAFLLIQKDVMEIFEYVEPSDQNLETYSYRIHEIILRTCIEIEANCKSILQENGFSKPSKDLTMCHYKLLEHSHRLSGYEVKLPHWKGDEGIIKPFKDWEEKSLKWYQTYNNIKHDRSDSFHKATFKVMLQAVTGLVTLLSAQFQNEDFSSVNSYLVSENTNLYEQAIGGYFQVKYPNDWLAEERYDFSWEALKKEPKPFQKFDFNSLSKNKSK